MEITAPVPIPNNKCLLLSDNEKSVVLLDPKKLSAHGYLPTDRLQTNKGPFSMSVSQACTAATYQNPKLDTSNPAYVYLFGTCHPTVGHKVSDMPSFPVLREIIKDQNLKQMITCRPEIVNQICPKTGNDALQFCILNSLDEPFKAILSAPERTQCSVALRKNREHQTALGLVLGGSTPQLWLGQLLDAVARGCVAHHENTFRCILEGTIKIPKDNHDNLLLTSALENQRGSRTDSFFSAHDGPPSETVEQPLGNEYNIFEYLGLHHPKAFLEFLGKLELIEADPTSLNQLLEDRATLGRLKKARYHTSPHMASKDLWGRFFHEILNHTGSITKGLGPSLGALTAGKISGMMVNPTQSASFKALIDPKQFPVQVGRLPFKGFSMPLVRPGSTYNYQVTPLQVITRACEHAQDASIFEKGSIARHLLNNQWGLLKGLFQLEMNFFLLYIALCSLHSWMSAELLVDRCYPAGTHDSSQDGNFFHWGNNGSLPSGVYLGWSVFLLSIVLCLSSAFYLFLELHEFMIEYYWVRNLKRAWKQYFDASNFVDVASFAFQAFINGFLAREIWADTCNEAASVRKANSIAILFLYLKLLHYAKGYTKWSKTVETFNRIVLHMKRFFAVLVSIGIGFAFAFTACANEYNVDGSEPFANPAVSLRTLTLYLFGAQESVEDLITTRDMGLVLFEAFMILEVIVLLNLMITVMGDSFQEVSEEATMATQVGRARIVVQMEHRYRMWHMEKNIMSSGCPQNCRPWVYVIAPWDSTKNMKGELRRSGLFSHTRGGSNVSTGDFEALEKTVNSKFQNLEIDLLPALEERLEKHIHNLEQHLLGMGSQQDGGDDDGKKGLKKKPIMTSFFSRPDDSMRSADRDIVFTQL